MTGFLTLLVLGLSLSVDAFAASIGKGAGTDHRLPAALKIGAVFGVVEALTPLAGWAAGRVLTTWISSVDHWIAFGLLGAVGAHMLWVAFRGGEEDEAEDAGKGGIVALVLTAVATSIDAAAVGVSLAVLDVNIVAACVVIGCTTFAMTTGGVLIGRHAGKYLGRYAEALGGAALIVIGSVILWEHLSGRA